MNMFKKNGGFTLVELIVVIAILAILAGVAVPAYSGYIAKAEQAGALQTLSAVNTAAQGLAVAKGAVVTEITVSADGGISVTCNPEVANIVNDIQSLLGENFDLADNLSDNFPGAKWTAGEWKLN